MHQDDVDIFVFKRITKWYLLLPESAPSILNKFREDAGVKIF